MVAFAAATPLELAVARAFTQAEDEGYFDTFPGMLQAKRDSMLGLLRQCGLKPIVPQGGYFTMIDTSEMPLDEGSTLEWDAETPLVSTQTKSFLDQSSAGMPWIYVDIVLVLTDPASGLPDGCSDDADGRRHVSSHAQSAVAYAVNV